MLKAKKNADLPTGSFLLPLHLSFLPREDDGNLDVGEEKETRMCWRRVPHPRPPDIIARFDSFSLFILLLLSSHGRLGDANDDDDDTLRDYGTVHTATSAGKLACEREKREANNSRDTTAVSFNPDRGGRIIE
uniref:Uncharacterized protein n=1 Tax=Caenorhabditis japonica TaxID=281687 RepID=A0A8R1IF84_CAEJA